MADSQAERSLKDARTRAAIYEKLTESGEKDRLKEILRQKLVENGWRDSLKQRCQEYIRQKGMESVTVEELVNEITPHGRATVPDTLKAELLDRIRKFIESQ